MPFEGGRAAQPSAASAARTRLSRSFRITTRSAIAPSASGSTALAPGAAVRAVAAIYLLLPQIPMLFMGEEWGTAQPFPFFCDFGGDLAEAVRTGAARGVRAFPGVPGPARCASAFPIRPRAETFAAAKLDWDELAAAATRALAANGIDACWR